MGLIVLEACADYFAGGFGTTGKLTLAGLAIGFYILGNVSWLIAIQNGSGLTKGAAIFSVASALLAIAIGIIFYKESVTTTQCVGIVFGILSIALIVK